MRFCRSAGVANILLLSRSHERFGSDRQRGGSAPGEEETKVKRSRFVMVLALVAAMVFGASSVAQAILLSELVSSQGTITQGDKLFSNFTASLNSETLGSGLTTPFTLGGISVA